MVEAVASEELRAFILRLYRFFEAGDADSMRGMTTESPNVVIIGTDPDEWWVGPQTLELLGKQVKELSGLVITPGRLVSQAMGSFGWVADDPVLTLSSGVQVKSRMSFVLGIERGQWRVLHWHTSIGNPNMDALGVHLTTSLDLLEQSIEAELPDLRPASAPDGTVTIAFTDIEASSAMMERLGDTMFLNLLAWHDRIVREAAATFRGYVVKSQGDGYMLAFPSSSEALRCIVSIRDRSNEGFEGRAIRVRAGLHSGEAIRREDDFFGRTVVMAARICSMARGGEILASDLVHALARGLGTFQFGEKRQVTLRGLDGSHAVYPVLA
ncbi:MAG: adenylate/guanylate cyclase domain-containing protein [Alphaproteobacteria bacterium]|jgi:class 3 adenylate cyclase